MIELSNILVISPHADDDVLGCGALMYRVANSGGAVHVAVMSMEGDERLREEVDCLQSLPTKPTLDVFSFDGLEDYTVRDTATWIENLIDEYRPQAVLIPNKFAMHQDHKKSAEAALIACRPTGGTSRYLVPIVLGYEVPSDCWPTDIPFSAQFTLELSEEEMLFKASAMVFHNSQDRPFPSERSKEALVAKARLRGSQVGKSWGESYSVYRIVA